MSTTDDPRNDAVEQAEQNEAEFYAELAERNRRQSRPWMVALEHFLGRPRRGHERE